MRISDWSSDVCSSDLLYPSHHMSYAWTAGCFLKIRADAFFKIARLANIQHRALGIQMPIDTWKVRQISQKRFEIEVFWHIDTVHQPAKHPSPARRWPASGGVCAEPKLRHAQIGRAHV